MNREEYSDEEIMKSLTFLERNTKDSDCLAEILFIKKIINWRKKQ